jgi:photosystem II stability/assembly factor-like uncharacterized protein
MRTLPQLALLPLAALCGCAGSTSPIALETSATSGLHVPQYTDTPRDVISWERPLNPARPNAGQRCGPPPPGYIKIVADPVPGWKPEDMFADGPGGDIVWYTLGPRPITGEYWSGNANAGGRVVSLAVHPTNPLVVYAASASGGIWKTTDGGQIWLPLTDELSILNHGAVTLDPSNPEVVYIGTGEYTTQSGGDGVFRSMDGGATWARIGTAAQVGNNISKVVVSPADPQVIHVSGSGGYVRTTNGGQTWSTRLTNTCSDLVVNPNDPQLILVGRANDGIYRSLDGGTTFAKLTGGLPTSGLRRIVLAMSQSNPQTVYAAITNTSNGLLGLYKTTDSGTSWVLMANTPNFPSPQAWYDCALAVDPTNENIVYAGGVFPSYAVAGIIRSTNGGSSWTDITVTSNGQVHPDQHAITFGPDGTVWVGNDGGIWKTSNPGSNWINCNATLVASQHYQVALHPTDPNRVIGGTQDNGTVQRTVSGGAVAWPQILSGDGGFAAYDFVTPSRRYITYVYLAVYRQYSGNTTNITGPWSSDSRNFIAPLIIDPNNATTLLGGTDRVWRTTNASGGASWSPISTNAVGAGTTLNAIAVARGASNTIYTGSRNGRVHVTTDASNWVNRSTGLPSGQISDIVIDPEEPGRAYVSYHSTSGSRVLRTDNYGVSWTSVTGSLPSGVGAKALAADWRFSPPGLFVGSGAGIYWSYNHGQTWTKDGTDLPNVNIGDLAIDAANNTITAGTYGRGVWRANLPPAFPSCYANCDGSTAAPVLNVADFSCFLQRFAAGDHYANCDGSTTPPILNVSDFSCFLSAFAAGCR